MESLAARIQSMRPAMTFKLLSIGIEPRNESAVIPVINSVDD